MGQVKDERIQNDKVRDMFYNIPSDENIFGLGLGASETEQKVQYRQIVRLYHPDMWNGTTGLTSEETADFFKLLNNANMFLRGRS
jgi:DnaJ-class molecular chaperone